MRIKKGCLSRFPVVLLLLISVSGKAQSPGCQHGKNQATTLPLYYSADNLRSDTFNILKYTINLEIGNYTNKLINGNTVIRFAPKINNQAFIRLDLLKLTIDSIKENTSQLLYSYNDTILKINFLANKNVTDTSNITVYYKGQPQGDASGWGGFYFDNSAPQYAYNLGVGFAAKPHNYGRVWFPCFDNFVERSKYEFNITCDTARRAYCNGQLTADVINGANRTRTWVLNEEIPTYLASVAVARYRQVNWTVNTLTGVKPIILAAAANDTTYMKNGFVNLKTCINGFENYYGPYAWNRFGYCSVPFSSGAMEHATNIAYPKAVLGNMSYEASIMAHELSHHWWGDLITCETKEDMWINEGMATYSQYMFQEWKYGKAKYFSDVKSTHDDIVHFLHYKEGFRAISGIPHNLTYGDHVYKKGADVAHTLRSYMGDTAFFNGVKYVMNQNKFKSINSLQLRDMLQTSSGQNLVDFFNNWVLSGGWPHFAVDSIKYVTAGSGITAVISIKQQLYGAPALFSNVPLEISFFKSDWTRVVKKVIMSGATATFTTSLPYAPVYAALNYDSKISDATSSDIRIIKSPVNINSVLGKVSFKVTSSGLDSSMLRIVHHYVKPDPFKFNPQNHKLSDQHYWDVEGILSQGFKANLTFNFNGLKGLSGTYSYLDTTLANINGDSIRIFYRPDASADWKLVKNCVVHIGPVKQGFVTIDTLKLGQYTFGNSSDTVTINSVIKNRPEDFKTKLYPNPAKNYFKIELQKYPGANSTLVITDVLGKVIQTRIINEKLTQVDISSYARGTYLVKINQGNALLYSDKLIVE